MTGQCLTSPSPILAARRWSVSAGRSRCAKHRVLLNFLSNVRREEGGFDFQRSIVAGLVSYPFDTVRRRLQVDAQRPLGERRYKGNLDCLKKVYRVEGVRALFRGAGYNALRTITSALALVAYGELKKRKRA